MPNASYILLYESGVGLDKLRKSLNNELVVKANNLIEGFTDMSSNEYKLTIHLISRIKKNDKTFSVQQITAEEFSDVLEVNEANIYTFLNKLENSLLSRKITIINLAGDRLKINWFSYTKYIKGTGTLEVAFNSHLAPYLLNLNINYTKYFVKSIRSLNSFYSIRIYELLKQYEKIGTRTFDIETLRKMLGICIDKYKKYSHLKERVILFAQKDIEKNSDITFTFEEVKESRKIIKLKFIVVANPRKNIDNYINHNKEILEDSYNDSILEDLQSKIEKIVLREVNFKILKNTIQKNHLKIEDFNYYLDNWGKFDYKSKNDPVAFFLYCVINRKPIPDKSEGITIPSKPIQSTNFEQRVYDDDFFNSLYDNFRDDEEV
jgi:plasmid replication initiation protein